MKKATETTTGKLLGVKTVVQKTSLSASTIRRLEMRGQFPERRRISVGRVAWLESEVDQWLENRSKGFLHLHFRAGKFRTEK